jgi:hypothetical protein
VVDGTRKQHWAEKVRPSSLEKAKVVHTYIPLADVERVSCLDAGIE